MPGAATTSDAFRGVAEPRRREMLNYRALFRNGCSRDRGSPGLEQSSVSRHLRVLGDVGLVHVCSNGRRMLYRNNAEAIRPLREWTTTFERFWWRQLSRVKERGGGEISIAEEV